MTVADRNTFSPAQRKRIVERAFAGAHVPDLAEKHDVSASQIYAWCQKPEYGGKDGGLAKHRGRPSRANGGANGATQAGVPLLEESPRKRSKKLIVN